MAVHIPEELQPAMTSKRLLTLPLDPENVLLLMSEIGDKLESNDEFDKT